MGLVRMHRLTLEDWIYILCSVENNILVANKTTGSIDQQLRIVFGLLIGFSIIMFNARCHSHIGAHEARTRVAIQLLKASIKQYSNCIKLRLAVDLISKPMKQHLQHTEGPVFALSSTLLLPGSESLVLLFEWVDRTFHKSYIQRVNSTYKDTYKDKG